MTNESHEKKKKTLKALFVLSPHKCFFLVNLLFGKRLLTGHNKAVPDILSELSSSNLE